MPRPAPANEYLMRVWLALRERARSAATAAHLHPDQGMPGLSLMVVAAVSQGREALADFAIMYPDTPLPSDLFADATEAWTRNRKKWDHIGHLLAAAGLSKGTAKEVERLRAEWRRLGVNAKPRT